jgi:hypothetical protein
VEGVPELGDDEQVLALHDALVNRTLDTLASLDLVAVVACAVKEAVAGLDGVVDLVGAGVVVDLPKTEAHQGHLAAVVQLNSGRRHCGGGEASVCS